MKALSNGGYLLNAKVCLQPASHSCTPRCPHPSGAAARCRLGVPGATCRAWHPGGTPTPQGDPQPSPGEEALQVGAQGGCPTSRLAILLFSENRIGSDPSAWHQPRQHSSHDLAEIGLTIYQKRVSWCQGAVLGAPAPSQHQGLGPVPACMGTASSATSPILCRSCAASPGPACAAMGRAVPACSAPCLTGGCSKHQGSAAGFLPAAPCCPGMKESLNPPRPGHRGQDQRGRGSSRPRTTLTQGAPTTGGRGIATTGCAGEIPAAPGSREGNVNICSRLRQRRCQPESGDEILAVQMPC